MTETIVLMEEFGLRPKEKEIKIISRGDGFENIVWQTANIPFEDDKHKDIYNAGKGLHSFVKRIISDEIVELFRDWALSAIGTARNPDGYDLVRKYIGKDKFLSIEATWILKARERKRYEKYCDKWDEEFIKSMKKSFKLGV